MRNLLAILVVAGLATAATAQPPVAPVSNAAPFAVKALDLIPIPAAPVQPVVGPLGRLGRWTADHVRLVAVAWAIVAVGFGFFAPQVETALSGAGWQANGSESVQARQLIERNFAGLSSSSWSSCAVESCTR